MNHLMYELGNRITALIESIFAPLKILPITLNAMIQERKTKRKSFNRFFINEVFLTGVTATPVIILIGISVGFIVNLLFPFDQIGLGIENIYGSVFSTFVFRELAPLLTAVVVLVRSTIAITIELTQMKIDGEIETLEILGINPIQFLGSFKIFAGISSVPVLTVYFSIAAMLSGMVSTYLFYRVTPIEYLVEISQTVRIRDLFIFLLRTVISGFLIFIIAIYNGLSAPRDINMIKTRTIRAITTSIFIIIIFNFFMTVSIYGIK